MAKKHEVEITLRDNAKAHALKITRQDVLDAMNVLAPEKLGVGRSPRPARQSQDRYRASQGLVALPGTGVSTTS
jgi:hypothetical protein